MHKACSGNSPQGQLGNLLPIAQLEKFIIQLGQRGMNGLLGPSLSTDQKDRIPGIKEKPKMIPWPEGA